MDPKCDSSMHGEGGLLRAGTKKSSTHPQDTLQLLQAIWVLKEVTVVHCKGHHEWKSKGQLGNNKDDHEASAASVRPDTTLLATVPWKPDEGPMHTLKKIQWMEQEGGPEGLNRW